MNEYGMELILDLHNCDKKLFTRKVIDSFFSAVCKRTDMQKCERFWWDDLETPENEKQINPKTKGTSAVQFILTSNITIHTLDELGNVYINFFSCKPFESDTVRALALNYFGGNVVSCLFIKRK